MSLKVGLKVTEESDERLEIMVNKNSKIYFPNYNYRQL